MRSSLAWRRAPVVGLVALAIVTTTAPLEAQADTNPRWRLPVDGRVVRPFQAPIAEFAAGHRGIDLAAAPGTPVRTAGDGVVSFAGTVAGALHVVVAHDGGLRTSYSFLATVDVHVGDPVAKGDIVGTAGGTGEGHEPGVVHFGLRVGDRYVDPMLLFEPLDLTELVRLVPADERRAPEPHHVDRRLTAHERRLLEEQLDFGGCGPLGEVCEAVADAAEAVSTGVAVTWDWASHEAARWLDTGLDLLRGAGEAGIDLARRLDRPLHSLLHDVAHAATKVARDAYLASPLARVLELTIALGKRLDELIRDCDSNAPDADGTGGSHNWLFAAAGNDSFRRTGHANANQLDWRSLGYARAEVGWFSYRPNSSTYGKEDTHRDLIVQAKHYGEQLQRAAAAHPGKPVDLIAHSQGGVIAILFLKLFYRGHEDAYPPIGKVITFASPLAGAPLAGVSDSLSDLPGGDALLDLIDQLGLGPPHDAENVRDLAPDSAAIRAIQSLPMPRGVEVLAIAGSADPLVPSRASKAKGVETYVVNVGGVSPLDDHSGIVQDADALRATRAFLEGRRLPCSQLTAEVLGRVTPEIVDVYRRLLPGGTPSTNSPVLV